MVYKGDRGMDLSINNRELKKLSAEEIADFVFLSFRISQGAGFLQKELFAWLRQKYPKDKLNVKQVNQAQRILEEKVGHFLDKTQGHKTIPLDRRSAQVKDMVEDLRYAFDTGTPIDEKTETLNKILFYTLQQDYKFLRGRGRPGKKEEDYGKRSDAYFSFFCQYALLGKTTGSAEYDQMYREVKDLAMQYLREGVSKKPCKSVSIEDGAGLLNKIIAIHNTHYPDMQINLNFFPRNDKE